MLRVVLVCLGLSACWDPVVVPQNPDGGMADDDAGPDADIDAPIDPCANSQLDPGETDIDCGGATCHKCAGGRHCAANSDCFGGNCGGGTCGGLPVVAFADAVSYPAGYKPYALVSGDLDGDGDPDLAVACEEESTVMLFRNTGTSSAVFQRAYENGFLTGEYPTGATIVDFNRDGIPDILTADYHGNSVSVLLGGGTGTSYTLAARASYPTVSGAETSNLAVGDLNGDGYLDVIATNPQAHSISVFLAQANGTLQPSVNVPLGVAGMSEPYSVAIGDYDHDGRADAAVADNRSQTMIILVGNGNGTFHPGQQIDIGGVASFIAIARDIDVDGNLDLVVANRSSDDISVLRGRGDGTFEAARVSSTGAGSGPYSIAVTDFNLDGVPDVVTADFMSGHASVLLGIGDGTFDPPLDTGRTGDYSYGVATGDFNGDGKPDFAVANANSNDVAIKLNTSH